MNNRKHNYERQKASPIALLILIVAITTILSCGGDHAVGHISGRVTDISGTPLSEAAVAIGGNDSSEMIMSGDTIIKALTDASGNYEITDIPPGFYILDISKQGYENHHIMITVSAGQTIKHDVNLTAINDGNSPPSPVRAQWYPIYYDWMDLTSVQVPIDKVNLVFVAFAHVYTKVDEGHPVTGLSHYKVPGVTSEDEQLMTDEQFQNLGDNNSYLGYENARSSSGTLTLPDVGDYDYNRIKKIVDQVHANGNKAVISLGWGRDWQLITDWSKISNDLNSENPTFVNSVKRFLEVHNLDGFDIDYESVSGISADDFNKLCAQLRQTFGSDYILSITPALSSPDDNLVNTYTGPTSLSYFDLVNFQSYSSDYYDFYESYISYVSNNKMTFGTCEDNPDSHDFPGAVNAYMSYQTRGVFNWQIQDDRTETTHTYSTPSGGYVTYNNFPSVNYFWDFVLQ
jgi:GH18 family chitinase